MKIFFRSFFLKFISRPETARLIFVLILVGYSIYFFRNWIFHFDASLAGDLGGDGSLTAWQIYWPYMKIKSLWKAESFPGFFDGNIFFGFKNLYPVSDMQFGWMPLVAILQLFTRNPILVINILHLLSLALLVVALYIFYRSYFRSELFSFSALGIFFLHPYTFDMMQHLQMNYCFALVFSTHFFRRWIFDLNRKHIFYALLFFIWLITVSVHLALFTLIGWALILFEGYLCKRLAFPKIGKYLKLNLLHWIFILLLIAISAGLIHSYVETGKLYHLGRLKVEPIYGSLRLNNFGGDFLQFNYNPENFSHEKNLWLHPILIFSFFWGFLRRSRHLKDSPISLVMIHSFSISVLFWIVFSGGDNPSEIQKLFRMTSFLALLVYFLRSGYLWLRDSQSKKSHSTRRRSLVFLVAASGISLLISFGPLVDLYGIHIKYITPYNLLYEFAPGFDRIRAVSRISILFRIFFSAVAAYGFWNIILLIQKSSIGLQKKNSFYKIFIYFIGGIFYLFVLYCQNPKDWTPDTIAPYVSRLEKISTEIKKGKPVLYLTSGQNSERLDALSAFASIRNEKLLINGYTGIRIDQFVMLKNLVYDYLSGRNEVSESEALSVLAIAKVGEIIPVFTDEEIFLEKEKFSLYRKKILDLATHFSQNATAIPHPCEDDGLGGEWRLKKETSIRHAVAAGFSPKGKFCTNKYGLLNDIKISLKWYTKIQNETNKPIFENSFYITSPLYYHPNAAELLYFFDHPGKRGEYEVRFISDEKLLHKEVLQIK